MNFLCNFFGMTSHYVTLIPKLAVVLSMSNGEGIIIQNQKNVAIQIVIDGGKPRFQFSKMHTFYIRNDPIVGISSDFFSEN